MLQLIQSAQDQVNNLLKSILHNAIVAKLSGLIAKFLSLLNVALPNELLSCLSVIVVLAVGNIIVKYMMNLVKLLFAKLTGTETKTKVKSKNHCTCSSKSSKSNNSTCCASSTEKCTESSSTKCHSTSESCTSSSSSKPCHSSTEKCTESSNSCKRR